MHQITEILKEIENCIHHGDNSLLTRRLMDLCEETDVPTPLKNRIYELRKLFLGSEADTRTIVAIDETNQMSTQLLHDLIAANLKAKHTEPLTTDTLLQATDISILFTKGSKPFKLNPLNVTLKAGEITGVVGENGNGKTTLLRILCGELAGSTGRIEFTSSTMKNPDWYTIKAGIAFIPQRISKWHGSLLDNLRFYASIHGYKGTDNDDRINYILYRLGLDKFRDLTWNEISSGYRLRFELAKMLLWKPRVLILDEPLANLDINAQQLLLQDLKFFVHSKAHPMSIILSSQNLHEIEKVADNIIFIRQGQTIYNGPQQNFAVNRTHNSYEVSGNFSFEEIVRALSRDNTLHVENAGTSYIITTEVSCNIYMLTHKLEQEGITITYIRDISHSTRKLFHKDI